MQTLTLTLPLNTYADEVVKFAPGLRVLMYYNLTQQKKKNVVAHLRDFDVRGV